MKRIIAIAVLIIIGLAFIIGSTIILYNSGGWGKVALFWLLMGSILLVAGILDWCVDQISK